MKRALQKIVCIISLFAVVSTCAAYELSQWQGGAGGDLSVASNWSLGERTFWNDECSRNFWVWPVFKPVPGYYGNPLTFTSSTDLTLAGLYIHEKSDSEYPPQEYIFDIGKDRTIYFHGTRDAAIWIGCYSGRGGVVRFKSGTYTTATEAQGSNKSFRLTPSTYGGMTGIVDSASARIIMPLQFAGYQDTFLSITNGGYYRGNFAASGTRSDSLDVRGKIHIAGRDPVSGVPSTFNGNGVNSYIFDEDGNNGKFTMIVENGGIITNFCGKFANRGGNATLIVDKGGKYYGATTDSLYIGAARKVVNDVVLKWPTNNCVTVRNGGEFNLPDNKEVLIGFQGYGNSFIVENCSTANVENVHLGHSNGHYSNNCSNRLVVSSGSYLNIYSGLSNCRASDCEIDISGKGTRVDIRVDEKGNIGKGIYICGSNTVMRIYDGAVVTNLEEWAGTRFMYNTRLEVRSGGVLWVTNGVEQGYSSASSDSSVLIDGGGLLQIPLASYVLGNKNMTAEKNWNNILWVGTDGILDVLRLRCFGYGNVMVISNGTVKVRHEFRTTYENNEESGGRTKMIFAGTKPRMTVIGTTTGYGDFQRECTVRFEIPEEGYETVPFEQFVGTTTFQGGSSMEFEFEDYARAGGGTLTLMKGKSIHISADQWESLQSELPEDCELYLTDDKKELKLKVKNKKPGLTFFLR